MRIAVIGTGNIGSTIGRSWAAAGHEVVFGSRHPNTAEPVHGATVADIATALGGAEATLLAFPARALEAFLSEHAAALHGQLILDATNNVGAATANGAPQIAAAVPDARYVRAFNTLGWENFADPTFEGQAADLFFSSGENDRVLVEALISDVGLRPVYFGEGKQDAVDHALPLWFALMQQRGNRRIAFRVLEK